MATKRTPQNVRSFLFRTRKGALTTLVFGMATCLELMIVVQAIRGLLSIDDAISKSEHVLAIATAAIMVTIYGISREDSAEKGRPLNVAAGGDATVVERTRPPPKQIESSSDETPAETPEAKRTARE